ncbi:nucleotidyl transferase AbiEii/AbiGii toxin family protein [Acinetobacter sp. ANC 3791]|uniref:nucleotidyl transferase AbiEii/AbiGii toxin family protein n=1 Tax=Acinetobacter sp. ANC 3791 TaxID=2529836 RepID=UPI00103E61D5|nr:nucleotidyl transferase AbiEii/AbiGii toxin family protein [Acinetobacter sp. ANC 3791]TCB86452.1 nucleotidyl transferase AbiEii/AbiGii toxin family protein [Acinetobacter sp. ANC 3791]
MSDIKNLFTDVADALGIGATSIVEKDYYVVELLKILQPLKFDSHDLVFAGGTSLAKASIQLNRMSEDVDIKIVPKSEIVLSRSQSKVIRKQLFQQIQEEISKSVFFNIEAKPIVNDEYRYIELLIRYPQTFNQSPCLRPFIKLELVETNLLEPFEKRNITSFVYDLTQQGCVVDSFPCVTIASTSIEKLVAILRRTAAFARNAERVYDESLVRHIYDYFKITYGKSQNFVYLADLAAKVIKMDIQRYGRQHTLMVEEPVMELLFGLDELGQNPLYKERFNNFVTPMVFGDEKVTWEQAYSHFADSVQSIFAQLKL